MISTRTQARLMKEYQILKTSNPPNFVAEYKEENILEWHFCIFGLEDPQYAGGYYHGKIIFPSAYPDKPPSIIMITPSGRFSPKSRICLTMSDFHPEQWNPIWRFEAIVQGLISFMLSEENSVGSIHDSAEKRKKFARESLEWNLNNDADNFKKLFASHFGKLGIKLTEPVAEERKAEPMAVPEERKADPLPEPVVVTEERKAEPVVVTEERKAEPVVVTEERKAEPVVVSEERKVEPVAEERKVELGPVVVAEERKAEPVAKPKRARKPAEKKEAIEGAGPVKPKRTRKPATGLPAPVALPVDERKLALENFKTALKQEIHRRLEAVKAEMVAEINRMIDGAAIEIAK